MVKVDKQESRIIEQSTIAEAAAIKEGKSKFLKCQSTGKYQVEVQYPAERTAMDKEVEKELKNQMVLLVLKKLEEGTK